MLQLFNDKVKEVYELVKHKYETNYPDKMDRFYHIEGVCEMATYLAKEYNVDVYKAQICALLHDYYKYEPYEEMAKVLTKEEILECENCKVLYHAYASSHMLKNLLQIDDEEMTNAIKYHVFGHLKMTRLEEIILISDYTEKHRKYPSCIEVRKTLLSGKLNQAIYDSTKYVIEFLKKENKQPHIMQYKILEEYERKIKND